MNIARSTIKIVGAKVISSIASFSAVIIFSRELGASPLGTFYPFLALLGILSIPADFGILSATEKRLSEGDDLGAYLSTGFLLKLPPLLLVSGMVLLASDFVNQYLGENLSTLLVVTLFVREYARLSIFILRGELRVGETAIIQVLKPLGWLFVGYIFFTKGYGVTGIVYGYLAGVLAMSLVGWWKVSIPFKRPTIDNVRSLVDYGRYSVISSVGGYFYSWMDVAILTLFVSLGIAGTRAQIGAYENAWRVSLVVMMISKALAMTLFPQISRWDAENATDRIESIIPTALLPSLLVVIPAFIGTLILSKDILRVLFKPEFTVAWLVLIILMGEKILQAVHVILGRCLQAINRPDLAAYATMAAVVVNLVLNIILIWYLGIVGAAVATTVSFAVNTLLHARFLSHHIDIDIPYREAVWSFVSSIIMGTVVYLVRLRMEINSVIELLAIVLVGIVVYSALIIMFSSIRIKLQSMARSVVS